MAESRVAAALGVACGLAGNSASADTAACARAGGAGPRVEARPCSQTGVGALAAWGDGRAVAVAWGVVHQGHGVVAA